MSIDRDTLILTTVLGGPLSTISYILYKGAEYIGPRINTSELLPNLPLQQGLPLLPRFTRRPELMQGLWEEVKIVGKETGNAIGSGS